MIQLRYLVEQDFGGDALAQKLQYRVAGMEGYGSWEDVPTVFEPAFNWGLKEKDDGK